MLFIYSIIPFWQIPTIVDNSKEYNKDKLSTLGITIAINELCRADIWSVVTDIIRRKGANKFVRKSANIVVTKRIANKEEGEDQNDYRNPKRN